MKSRPPLVNRRAGRPTRYVLGAKRVDVNASAVAVLMLGFVKGQGLTQDEASEHASGWFRRRGIRRVSASQAKKCYLKYFGSKGSNAPLIDECMDRWASGFGHLVQDRIALGMTEPRAMDDACRALKSLGVPIRKSHARRLWCRFCALSGAA